LILPYYLIPDSDRTEWELFKIYLLLSSVFYIYIIVFVPFIPILFFPSTLYFHIKKGRTFTKTKKKVLETLESFRSMMLLHGGRGGGYFGIIYFLILETSLQK